jgi:hypothetical protein
MSKKKKKDKQIKVKKVKKILKDKLKNIQESKTPLWGYNSAYIRTFIYDIIDEIKSRRRRR